MNKQEILRDLLTNKIKLEEVVDACKLFEEFNALKEKFLNVNIGFDVNMGILDIHKEVARLYNLNPLDIAKFHQFHNKMTDGHGYFLNKISLIKQFKTDFDKGLAESKNAIELLYG